MAHANFICRFCSAEISEVLLDLGEQPPSNAYLRPDGNDIRMETLFPLQLIMCETCRLAQLGYSVPPSEIFHGDYAYFSSYSESWLAHASAYSRAMIERFDLDADSFVVEVASNDGYLLRNFVAAGISCLGVEPAANCAAAAQQVGVESYIDFFGVDVAQSLIRTHPKADLTVANNVLAHVPDINDFVAGFAILLAPEGVSTFEFPHLQVQVQDGQFDTIYHEHYSYLSLTAVETIFARHGLRIFDVERIPTHGGSLRVFSCHQSASHQQTSAVAELLRSEEAAGIDTVEGVRTLANKAHEIRKEFVGFLSAAKAEGKSVAAYGAAAKGNTMLNFCQVTSKDIAFVVDKNIHKQGRLLPGSHVPIYAPNELRLRQPDYVIILPWNLTSEVRETHSYIADWGGRFVAAQPTLSVF